MGLFKIVTKPIGCFFSLIGALVVLLVLLVVGFFWAIDKVAPEIAERAMTEGTGFPTTIQESSLNFKEQTITLKDIEIDNPEDFPEREFMHIAEFTVGIDRKKWSAEQMALSQVRLIIDEMSFIQGSISVSNLETFILAAEENWAQMVQNIYKQAASENKTVPENFIINNLEIELRRIKLVNVSGPETLYRAVDVNYAKKFENVDSIRPIIESIAQDMQANGLSDIAQTLEEAGEEMDDTSTLKMLQEQLNKKYDNAQPAE